VVVDGFSGGTRGVFVPPFFCYDTRSSKANQMSVNLEVKGSLAKCLATENLIIEHKKVPTAMFDVGRRVLTLPTWDKASATVYDLLVGHEVGHALFTDNVDWSVDYPEVPKDFVNVLEDVRVEKLMKKKYAGLSRTFFNGYNELNNDDFFSTKEENLDELSFIDRINLYYKIGAFHNIAFNDDEDQFLTRAGQTETFDEVLELAREIVEFVKYKRQKVDSMPTSGEESEMSGSGEEVETPQSSQSNENQTELEQDSQEQSQTDGESFGDEMNKSMEAPSGDGFGQDPSDKHSDKNELESKTSKSFDEKSKDLVDKYSQETEYVELPEMILENLIIPNEFIHKKAKEDYSHYQEFYNLACKEYASYKKSAEKEVSYLVKEFECKKSADQYARASTARTGVLDTQKLHTYKFNEDLFKKVSVVPDGKNHGLIFILDWSGSMSNFILDAYKQLLNLVWFCRKVNIPFEVYAFTLDCNSYVELQPNHPPVYNKVSGVIAPEASFRLMNFFTSKTNNRVLEEQLKNIWAVCYAYQNHNGFVPRHLDLSGSPIGESIIALHSLIPDFQAKNKLQKVNVIFLTDGEGYQNAVTKEKTMYGGETHIGMTRYNKTSIRDRKSGRVYRSFDYDNFPQYAKILLETVKDRFPMVNLINFRITPSRDFQTCYRWYGSGYSNYETVKAEYRKNQCISFKDTGFDQFHVIAASSLAQDEEFSVPEDASKAQIKSAFVKMLGKKKTNKKLLGSFVELIA
jgi:hypothetical protein